MSPSAGHRMVSTAGLWKRARTMWNVPVPTCLSTQPMLSLPHLCPTTRPFMPQELSASQVLNMSSILPFLETSLFCFVRILFWKYTACLFLFNFFWLLVSIIHPDRYYYTPPITINTFVKYNWYFFIIFPLSRLCLGHCLSHAVFPFPHVCCQTAHSHDAELSGNTGNTNELCKDDILILLHHLH